MAQQLLKSWNAPVLVSAVSIDASARKATQAAGSRVSGLSFGDTISWKQLDDALPMPVNREDPVMALALSSSDFDASLNQQRLKVTGLAPGQYQLRIDGAEIGAYSDEEWARGINLAVVGTPMMAQAKEVHDLTLRHNNIHFERWRRVQVPMAGYDSPKVSAAVKTLMEALDEEEEEVVKAQRAKAQPAPRQFELFKQ
jgi:hypothetical protein